MNKALKIIFLALGIVFLTLPIFSAEVRTGNSNEPRYISLAPSTTEILFALGLNSELALFTFFPKT